MNRPARRDPSKLSDAAGFREFVAGGWGEGDRRAPVIDGAARAAAEHRERLSHAFPGRRIAVAAGRAPVRANDTDYDFRPDSDFLWLTGCRAEGAVLVMQPSGDRHDAVLYLRRPAGPGETDFFASARDGELWIGAVPGLAEWSQVLQVTCRPLEQLPGALRGNYPPMLATLGVEPLLDSLVLGGGDQLRQVLAELRRIKDDWEVGQLREAVDATTQAFADVAGALGEAVAGGGERWLQGTFDRRARTLGNGVGYASIIAAGQHAPVLHWVRNDGPVAQDAAILLDAGVEMNSFYTADVTRTFPVSGEFSAAQRSVYDLVHSAHVAAMAQVRPGVAYRQFHQTAMAHLAQGLHDWGLLPVGVEEALDPKGQQHRRYIVCGVGHYLGLDVHDCASSSAKAYHEGTLESGMALTVEPGLYFHPNDETVPPELRGIGVRIEDDLMVTDSGNTVLSDALPITAEGIGRWVREHRG
ncbi:MAG: aminopeptidase P family protein [Sciscionella sp.]